RYSPDGKILAAAGEDKSIRLWDAATGKEMQRLYGHREVVTGFDFFPDSKSLASIGLEKFVYLWEAKSSDHHLSKVQKDGGGLCLLIAPHGRTLAMGCKDRSINLFDIATGHKIRTLAGHTDWVLSLAFSANGQWLASSSSDSTVRLWEIATGKEIGSFTNHDQIAYAVAFAANGRFLASASEDKTA